MDIANRVRLVHQDWETREGMDAIQIQLLHVVEFINRFHASTTMRLASLHAKLHSVERNLRYVEAAVRQSDRVRINSQGQHSLGNNA